MNRKNTDGTYAPEKVPARRQEQDNGACEPSPKPDDQVISLLSGDAFFEIDYDATPFPGVGKLVRKSAPEKIEREEAPKNDPIRELFGQMREIGRTIRQGYDQAYFFERRVQQDNSLIFYNQGMFMKDFTDDYDGNAPFMQYFPYYHMLGYEQLRTYFTWRTKIRRGDVNDTSLSYAFLYIYELLGNIGVADPSDGLHKLVAFWKDFRDCNQAIDKYVIRWLKEYHVYYDLPHSFGAFVKRNGLGEYYPGMDPNNRFALYCAISKYDVRKSGFYTGETAAITEACFIYVMERIERELAAAGICLDDILFTPSRKPAPWKPFKDALFHDWLRQPERRVVLSAKEMYLCKKLPNGRNEWLFSANITGEAGRQFVGSVMKQTESVLRRLTGYKPKLAANLNMTDAGLLAKLTRAGLSLDKLVSGAVIEYYREANKTVVTVDRASLERIREEVKVTQEALIVEEETAYKAPEADQNVFDAPAHEEKPAGGVWDSLKDALSDYEIDALRLLLRGGDVKAFADERGMMAEVLADGINEKAMDHIGDNLMDEDFLLYEDYIDEIKEWMQ